MDNSKQSSAESPSSSIKKIDFHESVHGPIHTGSGNIIYTVPEYELSSNRKKLLEKVNGFWIEGLLKDSLHDANLIDLEKVVVPNVVNHAWEDVVYKAGSKTELSSTHQPMWELFNSMGHALLILGEPGAGKTTTLLDLAREAHQAALADPSQPIPIYLNLSSWRGEKLIVWLIAQLGLRYQTSESISRPWLEQTDREDKENNQLLLLLDGLDEVAPQYRKAIIIAINEFRGKGFGRYMAVACREQVYDDLRPLQFHLDGSILLKRLTLTQIDEFLMTVAPELTQLRVDLQQHQLLWDLARKPLMLNVMVTVYQGGNPANLDRFESLDALTHFLFEQYSDRMFRREVRTDPKSFSEAETRKILSWLAENLIAHHQSAFLLENMQPSWLTTQRQQTQYAYISRVATAVTLGFLFGGFPVGIVIGLLGGVIVGWLVTRQFAKNAAHNTRLVPSRQTFIKMALVGGLITFPEGLLLGGMIYFIMTLFGMGSLRDGLVISLLIGTGLAVIRGLVYGLVFGSSGRGQDIHTDIQRREELVWSWNKARTGLRAGLGTGLLISLLVGVGFSVAIGFLSNSVGALIFGAATFLTIEFIYGLLGGLFNGLRGQKKEVGEVKFPGAGLWEVFTNAMLGGTAVGLIGGLLLGILGAVLMIIIVGLIMEQWLVAIPAAAFGGAMLVVSLGITVGGLAALWFGGIDLIQHHTLRLLLRYHKTIPAYRLVPVLDYASERILLRRVGGGYIFIHPLLREYFAAYERSN